MAEKLLVGSAQQQICSKIKHDSQSSSKIFRIQRNKKLVTQNWEKVLSSAIID
jgi:hypothetical protein